MSVSMFHRNAAAVTRVLEECYTSSTRLSASLFSGDVTGVTDVRYSGEVPHVHHTTFTALATRQDSSSAHEAVAKHINSHKSTSHYLNVCLR